MSQPKGAVLHYYFNSFFVDAVSSLRCGGRLVPCLPHFDFSPSFPVGVKAGFSVGACRFTKTWDDGRVVTGSFTHICVRPNTSFAPWKQPLTFPTPRP